MWTWTQLDLKRTQDTILPLTLSSDLRTCTYHGLSKCDGIGTSPSRLALVIAAMHTIREHGEKSRHSRVSGACYLHKNFVWIDDPS